MKCKGAVEVYSRIVGYFRPVEKWSCAKQQEYKDRKLYDPDKIKKFVVDNN